MRISRKMPSLSNVAAGSEAVLNLPLGNTYDKLMLEYSGVTLEQMKNIRLEINGKVVQQFKDGQRVIDINTYYGRPADDAGLLTFWFVRPEMLELKDQRLTALGTLDIKTLALRFDIDAAATAPKVTAWAVLSERKPLGMITKIKTFTSSVSTSGEQEIDNIPRGNFENGIRIAAIHAFKSDILKGILELDSRVAFELPKTIAENVQRKYGRSPLTAKASHFDFVLEGEIVQSITTKEVQDFRLKLDHNAAGSTDVVVEYLEGLQGL